MKCFFRGISTLLFLIAFSFSWAAYPSSRNRNNPLIGDEGRKHPRASECHFGKTIRELGSTWFADLGPPFGVMYCIRCECVPVQKKRRIVARVQCRNIKHECPKPTCDDPVLHPGRCCKLCPGDAADIALDLPPMEEDKYFKHFGALLTPRTSLIFKRDDIVNIPSISKEPALQVVATGRFTYHKKNLYYSFYLSNSLGQMPPRPKTIQFIHKNGDLLMEQNLATSHYQNVTEKICGVWRRVPKDYKRFLKTEFLYVALLWSNDLALSGRIARFKTLSTEHYTALMTPPSSGLIPPDGGGTAILSVSSTVAGTNSIHITLVFNGVFTPNEINNVPLTVKLESSEKIMFEEEIRVTKPSSDLNIEEVRFSINASDLRQLTRGKAFLTLSSKSHPDLMFINGPILPKAACEIYQAPLSLDPEIPKSPTRLEGAGLVWIYVTRDGGLAYNWQLEGIAGEPSVSLVQRTKVIHVLNATSSHNRASGLIEKLPPRSIDLLYTNELSVKAVGERGVVLSGSLVTRPVADAVDSTNPVLLMPLTPSYPQNLVGLAWMTINMDCELHYEVQLVGGHSNQAYQLYLEDTPMIAQNAPISRRLLEDFNGTLLEGSVLLQNQELTRIDAGICFLEVVELQTGRRLLRANMKPIQISRECLSTASDNEVPRESPSITLPESKCYHEGVFYDEGKQWRHARDPCKMCHCHRGKEVCDDIVCPKLSCQNQVKLNNFCCPSCANGSGEENTPAGCYLADVFYPAGSSWHPYLPPYGFNICTVVTCGTDTTVKYTKVNCPPLDCPEKEQVRLSKGACCKVCQEELASDQAVIKKEIAKEDMRDGRCFYLGLGPFKNNTSWPHSIPTVGIVPCVHCRCRDGNVTCERKKCPPRAPCPANGSVPLSNSTTDECCSQCRRTRRQSRHKQRGGGGGGSSVANRKQ